MSRGTTSALHGDTVAQHPPGGWRSFLRMLKLLAAFRGHVVLSVVLALATIAPTLLIPEIIGRVVDIIAGRRGGEVATWLWILVGVALGRAVIWFFRRLIAGQISLGVEYDLRERLYRHLLSLPEAFHLTQQTGQLMSRITVDVSSVRFFLGYGLIYFATHLLTLISVSVIVAIKDLNVAFAFYAMMILMVCISRRFSVRVHGIYAEVQQRVARVTAAAEENIVGHRVVRSFAQEEAEIRRFRGLAEEVVDAERRSLLETAKYRPLYDVLPSLTLIGVVFLSARAIEANAMTPGDFVALFFFLQLVTMPLRVVGNILSRAQRATAAAERIFAVLDRDDHLPVPAEPQTLGAGPAARVEFRNVGFAYPDGRRVLDDVTFVIEPGETVALLGRTGSGKSTAAALLSRVFDPDTGSVLVDGIDVRSLDLADLRRSVGVVSQDPYLFSDTVTGNIGFGRPSLDAEEAREFAAVAQADEFVQRLPHRYETVVGERGLTLSGGQRQRLALARALAAQPKVLILDDATASVDAESEALITEALHGATGGQTTVLIAHRPSTIRLADRIIVLDQGRIVAEGQHERLLGENELYRDIFAQLGRPEARQ